MLHTNGDFYGNTGGNSLGGSVFYSLNVGFKPLVELVTWTGKVGATVEILGQGFTGTTGCRSTETAAKFVNTLRYLYDGDRTRRSDHGDRHCNHVHQFAEE